MNIQTKALSELTAAPYNPRQISDVALAGLQASVERFGLVEPVIWNQRTGHVVGGHQRLKALAALGRTETDVVVVDLPEIEEKALNVALNNPLITGEFTDEALRLLEEIAGEIPEAMSLLRLDDLEEQLRKVHAELAPTEGLTGSDEVPEAPEIPVTQPGDLWILGGHRLICGDSGDPEILDRLMEGKTAALYATDPPYGVGYDGTAHPKNSTHDEQGRAEGAQNKDWGDEYWDHYESPAAFQEFLERIFINARRHVAEDAAWYCWHASVTTQEFMGAWAAAGVRYHQTIIWVKPTFVLGFLMWNYRTEPCLMGWQQGHKPQVQAVTDEYSNCWEVDWEGKARCTDSQHPTQKPIRLFELPMLKHTRPGDICLETFAGSGSQLIAAERLGRRCYAVERMPVFCDVIVRRWEAFTGQQAKREPRE